ncbi:MAG TPA: hypothetical protein VF526_16750 [Solirubrobacteraceae bacterium]
MTASDPYRSLRPPAHVAVALLALCLIAGAVAFVLEMNHYGVLSDLHRGVGLDPGDLSHADALTRSADVVRFGAFLAAATAFSCLVRARIATSRAWACRVCATHRHGRPVAGSSRS